MSTTYLINLSAPQPYESQALIVATLARPSANEVGEREKLYLSLCSWLIRERAARDPVWADELQPMTPRHACRREDDIKRDMKTLDRRLRDRITAGYIAVGFLKEAESGLKPTLPNGVNRLNIEQMATSVLGDLGMADTGNVRARVWAPSLPVIHLCSAWVTLVQDMTRAGQPSPHLLQAIQERDLLIQLVARAELHVPLLERSRRRIKAGSLTRFKFAQT